MEHLMGSLALLFTRWVAPVEKSPASYGVDPHFWPVGRCGKLMPGSWKPMIAVTICNSSFPTQQTISFRGLSGFRRDALLNCLGKLSPPLSLVK